MNERFYVVDDRPQTAEERLVLSDGSAVICSVSNEYSAHAIVASDRRLEVRRHSDLCEDDQQRIKRTF